MEDYSGKLLFVEAGICRDEIVKIKKEMDKLAKTKTKKLL